MTTYNMFLAIGPQQIVIVLVVVLLLFGGSDGAQNPTLATDFVDSNDRDFSPSFPYLPTPW